jgi:hypothetical protein
MPSELEAQCQHPEVLSQLLEQGFTLAQARHYLEVTEPSDVSPQNVPNTQSASLQTTSHSRTNTRSGALKTKF